MVVDRLLRLASVDLAVLLRRNEDQRDHRYHFDLVVVLQNVDQEAVASLSADLDRILAVSRRGYLRQGIEIGRGTEKEIVTAIAIVTVTVTVIAIVIVTVTEIASGIEIVIYCPPDIDHQSDHLRDFKERGIVRETGRDHASLEMDTTLTTAIHRLTITHSVIVNAIYRLGRDRYRDIP